MPDSLSIHRPILVNTIGHAAGVVIFGMLLYFLLVSVRRGGNGHVRLPVFACVLAMLWNLGSLIALAIVPSGARGADVIVAGSFSALSLLPAVLLHISLGDQHRWISITGYSLSSIAVLLHAADCIASSPQFHYAALLLVTIGFSILTAVSVYLELRHENHAAGSRLAASMGLFLFAISFVHFAAPHTNLAWSKEVAIHHAGIPLALLVLLQDYRFLLLDTFLRFIVNGTLAAAAVLVAIRVIRTPGFDALLHNPFEAGLLFVSASLLLVLFVYVRNRTQSALTRFIFMRSNVDDALKEMLQLAHAAHDEQDYLRCAADVVARFFHAPRFELSDAVPEPVTGPSPILNYENWAEKPWVQAIMPIRFSRGDAVYLLLGPREGGRRYLSEDFAVMSRLAAAAVEHIEQLRSRKMQNLVSQAELKALQAQINPHFLFNSLNTLYGTIDRNNAEARKLVLNLSDVFRYLLRSERNLVELEEELKIVRAYLAIEELRLGGKLSARVEVDDEALHVPVPLLSIQPLVENAIKHGVAATQGPGFVHLKIRHAGGALVVEVVNSGEWNATTLPDSPGIGLSNVRRRIELCYGSAARFRVSAAGGVTTVGFVLPAGATREVPATV
jgi:two-component system, LytTR family, sensor kinase